MTPKLGSGSLKCIIASSPGRSLRDVLEQALRARVAADDICYLFGDVLLVYTDADQAAIRDWLAPQLREGESAFVVEFERWSGCGPAPDREWLLRRGH